MAHKSNPVYSKHFGWSYWLPDDKKNPACRLWIEDDCDTVKITYSRKLSIEQTVQVADWIKKVCKDLKKIRDHGWTNKVGAEFNTKPTKTHKP